MPATKTAEAKRAHADLMARRRASERDMKPPEIKDLAGRLKRESNDVEWLEHYMGHIYQNPLSDSRLENIRQIIFQRLFPGGIKFAGHRWGLRERFQASYLILFNLGTHDKTVEPDASRVFEKQQGSYVGQGEWLL